MHLSEDKLARLLEENADEPCAGLIANLLKERPIATTDEPCRGVRVEMRSALPHAAKGEMETSICRTFQALRIAVNVEFSALDLSAAAVLSKPAVPSDIHVIEQLAVFHEDVIGGELASSDEDDPHG